MMHCNRGVSIQGVTTLGVAAGLQGVRISGNVIIDSALAGIEFIPGAWVAPPQGQVAIITDNVLANNDRFNPSSPAGVQIQIGSGAALGTPNTVFVICRNNDCAVGGPIGGTPRDGSIRVICPGPTTLPATTAMSSQPQGLHTNLQIVSGAIVKAHTNLAQMVENSGVLVTS